MNSTHYPLTLLLACLVAAAAPAQSPTGPNRTAVLRLAEARYRAGDLLEAAGLYRRALDGAEGGARVRCFEQLITIYAKLGRVERTIHYALRYRDLLRQGNNPERLRELEGQLGECYLALGHYHTAESYFEAMLADRRGLPPLSPLKKLVVLGHLARSAEECHNRDRAGRFWREVERLAVAHLAGERNALSPGERLDVAWKLADSYRFRGDNEKAIQRLTPLLVIHDQLRDPKGKRDTLRRLAGHHAALRQHERAEKYLRQALHLHGRDGGLLSGDLADELAEAVAARGRAGEAERWSTQAARAYQAVLDGGDVARVLTAFWKLQKLYQKNSQYRRALQLAESAEARNALWTGRAVAEPKIQSEQGTLQVILGAFAKARVRLRQAVTELERQQPVNLIDLPRALNNLAIVEQATGDLDQAEKLARRCLELHRKYRLPDGLILVETHNLLGACAAERGKYTDAIRRFRRGIELCEQLGKDADPPHSNLLLNVALLHKSQGDSEEAALACSQAKAVYQRFASPNALGFAAFAAAEISLDLGRHKLAEAYARVPRILELCRKHDIRKGPLLITAYHCEGLYRLSLRETEAAEQAWRRAREMQEEEKAVLLLPRTLNYLALVEELRRRPTEAEGLYRRALSLQRRGGRAFPVTHFITLWRLAGLADARGQRAEGRKLLEEALDVIEQARLQTYGDDQLRADYYSQFEPGFDRLAEWCVRDGDVEAAFVAVTRGRSRTLLDQLRLARVDPRDSLKGKEGEELRRRERELGERIAGLRARAQLIPIEAAGKEGPRKLLAALDQAQKDYAGVWRKILRANPLCDRLSANDGARALTPAARERLLGPKTLLLVYHIGRERSHLLLLGGRDVRPEAFTLTVPAALAGKVTSPEPLSLSVVLAGKRGFEIKKRRPGSARPAPSAAAAKGAAVPLGRKMASVLVEQYCQDISDPEFRPSRAFELRPRDPARPVAAQRNELLGDVLLPPALRERIRRHRAERLVVVPDGPLHKLPLEALLLETEPRVRYAADELPPIIYAPSASVLALLAERPAPDGPLSLLTVCDPAYPQSDGGKEPPRDLPLLPLAFRGQLARLPGTAAESDRVKRFFDPARVRQLKGEAATEKALTAEVQGKRVIHIAAHGFADQRFGNLFGALALMPPRTGRAAAGDDGFLSLREICTLPLQGCELAVLSACVTNVGPQRPLEAGVTLAGGFLAAGARRVVASHWSVDDESTAQLMATFFEEVTAARWDGRPDYARALQRARRKVRDRPEWSAPYFWAPFVLIGPAR